MNWEALGAVGEVVAAIAVIVTLGYLALQIRQNTRQIETNTQAARLTAIDSVMAIGVEVRRSILENEDVARIYETGLADPDQLSGLEQTRFRVLMMSVMMVFHAQYGQMGYLEDFEEGWAGMGHALRRILTQPGGARFWDSSKHEFPANFIQEVDRVLSERVTP